ncbi:hypothetical protein FLA_3943 [Filimonas lacunae]|nr:hypothetical protein FLA_3943 [Filimonas lacunae]
MYLPEALRILHLSICSTSTTKHPLHKGCTLPTSPAISINNRFQQ